MKHTSMYSFQGRYFLEYADIPSFKESLEDKLGIPVNETISMGDFYESLVQTRPADNIVNLSMSL